MIREHEVPDAWTASWPSAPEGNPIVYLQQLSKRLRALLSDGNWPRRILDRRFMGGGGGGNSDYLNQCGSVRLADFLRPEIFLNALRQETSRILRVPLDALVLVCSFNGAEGFAAQCRDPQLTYPIQLEGLLLEGAAFEGGRVVEVQAAGQSGQSSLLAALPPATLAWTPEANKCTSNAALQGANSGNQYAPGEEVDIPLYVSLNREKLLCSVPMRRMTGAGGF